MRHLNDPPDREKDDPTVQKGNPGRPGRFGHLPHDALLASYCWWQGVDQEAANRVEVTR